MSGVKAIFESAKIIAKSPLKNPHTVKAAFAIKKHAPSILVYSGVLGMVGSTVLACNEIFEANQTHLMAEGERIRIKNFVKANPDSEESKTYNKDITVSYIKEGAKLVKDMTPALTLGGLSIAAILTGHNMLNKRHLALVGAYATLQTSYDNYRDAVKEALGDEAEEEIRKNIVLDSANGKVSKEKPLSDQVNPNGYSVYARCFDESNINWNDEPLLSQFFLRNVLQDMNVRLRTHGYVTLNEVYEALGFQRTRSGNVIGWVLGKGDSQIDFGMFEDLENVTAFRNGEEKAIWLDFNVDGYIYNDIPAQDY